MTPQSSGPTCEPRAQPVHRIVVTGLGAVTPFGAGVPTFEEGLFAGEHGIESLSLFDAAAHRTGLAAQVPDDDCLLPLEVRDRLRGRLLSRSDRFALQSALEAWNHADLGRLGSVDDLGLFFGTSTAGMFEGENAFHRRSTTGIDRMRVKGFASQPNGSSADAISAAFGVTGPVEVLGTACAASTLAVQSALDALRAGETDVALAAGSDGLCQTTFGGFNALRAIDAALARPFRAGREGLSLGEGAACLVLERENRALSRGARPIAILEGAGSSCDAHHMTAPHPGGDGARRAINAALTDSGVTTDEVSFVNAHGSGTPHNDEAEANALRMCFGDDAATLPVTSTKGAVGHTLGTCGVLEAVATILCLERRAVHPTPGGGELDPAALVDLVLDRPRSIEDGGVGLSVNLAFGGANAALVLRRWTAPA